jgi:lysophospholipase L1-like esterase
VKSGVRLISLKSVLANLGLACAAFLFALIVLELGLRAVEPAPAPEPEVTQSVMDQQYWATYDADLGYRLNPRWGDINPDGLRDHPVMPKSGFRLLFLGDSIGYMGETIEDTMVAYFRNGLNGSSATKVDVLNASIKGYTNYQELLFLKKFGLKFEPDLVGVQFCLNDVHKFLQTFQVYQGRIVPNTYHFSKAAVETNPAMVDRLLSASRLFAWLNEKLPIAKRVTAIQIANGFSFDYVPDMRTAWMDDQWLAIESQFAEMRAIGDKNHFNIFVVVMPLGSQYNEEYLARDRNYVLKPQRKLKEICDKLKIPFYDLYPVLHPGLFDEDGVHLSPEGRRFAGERIAEFVKRLNLVPGN